MGKKKETKQNEATPEKAPKPKKGSTKEEAKPLLPNMVREGDLSARGPSSRDEFRNSSDDEERIATEKATNPAHKGDIVAFRELQAQYKKAQEENEAQLKMIEELKDRLQTSNQLIEDAQRIYEINYNSERNRQDDSFQSAQSEGVDDSLLFPVVSNIEKLKDAIIYEDDPDKKEGFLKSTSVKHTEITKPQNIDVHKQNIHANNTPKLDVSQRHALNIKPNVNVKALTLQDIFQNNYKKQLVKF